MVQPSEAEKGAWRDLVRRLDALIKKEGDYDELATEWLRLGGLTLTLRAGAVLVQGAAVGSVAEQLGGWARLLWQCGVRSLRPRPSLTGEAVAVLARRLRRASDDADGARQLRRWLWLGSCFGIQVNLGPSMWQRSERFPPARIKRAEIDQQRARAVETLAHSAVGTDSVDALVVGASEGGAVALAAFRQRSEESHSWLLAQLSESAPANLPEGAEGAESGEADAPSDRVITLGVAREQLERGSSLALLAAWESLASREDALAQAAVAQISVDEAGRAAGRNLSLRREELDAVSQLLDARHPFGAGVVSGLLERARDARSAEALASVIGHLGLHRVWQASDLEGISAPAARGLALVLKRLDAGPSQWTDLIGYAPPKVAAWILRSAPPSILSRVGASLRQQLVTRPPQDSGPLIEALTTLQAPAPIKALGQALLETRGHQWPPSVMPGVFQALLNHGQGETVVLPLFFDREADEGLRLLALRSLSDHPTLLKEACKFRLGELMEPPRIQARVKAARKDLKAMK